MTPSYGNPNAKLMILADAPPNSSEKQAFSEMYWREFNNVLFDAGIARSDCWFSYVSHKYVPPILKNGNKIPFKTRAEQAGVDLEECHRELRNEINEIRPNCILALGKDALYAVTGHHEIQQYRGSILQGYGSKVVATYNPTQLSGSTAAEFAGYYNRHIMVFDFKRAFRQSQFKEHRPPTRLLSFARSSSQIRDFLGRYRSEKSVAVDIEARGQCIPFCVGLSFKKHEGLTIPLWNEGEMAKYSIPKVEMLHFWLLLSEVLSTRDIIGQNFKYDEDKLRMLGFKIKRLISDTMFKSFAVSPELPLSLAFQTSICTEEPFYKDDGMYEGDAESLLIGCARDACVTKEIDEIREREIDYLQVREYYENFIMHLHPFYLRMETEGMYINPQVRDSLFEKYIRWSETLQHELFSIVGDFVNVNSPKQMNFMLYETFKIPKRKGTGEEVITEILNMQSLKLKEEHRRALEIVLEKRRVDKTIGTYLAALPDYDKKMKTTFFPCLKTGRSSTGQLDPPIRPALEIRDEANKKKKKFIGTAFQTLTKHGDIGADIREQYVPEKGHVFIQADSAQAEARVVFLLADDEQALRDIDERDFHALTASWFFGGTEADYSKRIIGFEHPIRFVGKTLRHAGHLGASKRRAALSVNTDARKFKIPITITEKKAGESLEIFHKKQPKIREVFQNGVIEELRKNRMLRAPVPWGINAKMGPPRMFLDRWGDELFREAFSYIPQRAVSDNTKAAGLRLQMREPSLRIVMESHDALLFMIPESEVDYFKPMIKEEMERPIRFDNCSLPRRDLVIPCELEIGYDYYNFKKVKM